MCSFACVNCPHNSFIVHLAYTNVEDVAHKEALDDTHSTVLRVDMLENPLRPPSLAEFRLMMLSYRENLYLRDRNLLVMISGSYCAES